MAVPRNVPFETASEPTRRIGRKRAGPTFDLRARQRYLDDDHNRSTNLELSVLGSSGRVRPFLTFDRDAGGLNFRGPLTAGADLTNWPEWEEERPE